jgi:DNA-binding NtrC family response regulator
MAASLNINWGNGEPMLRDWQSEIAPTRPLCGGPQWPPKDRDSSAGDPSRTESGKNVKIIVIDDESLIAETVVEILNEQGFEAVPVSSGASAIELAKTVRPAIVLSDVIMPGMNGIETGIKIREIVPNCRVILFSGQAATVDLLEEAREKGLRFDILAKPIKPETLISIIRSSLPSQ